MNYGRFGRLNSKKITELKNNNQIPYGMEKFFPYLPTRSQKMDQRHTITSFKTMTKKYKCCYSLYSECLAEIKMTSLEAEEVCIAIDNKVYVFTNISSYDFDTDNCELLFDTEVLIPIHDKPLNFSYQTKSVLANMKERKLSPIQYKLLDVYLSQINFVSVKSEYIELNELDEAVFREFVWRLTLYDTDIYKVNGFREHEVTNRRSRVQDFHTILSEYDRYGSLEYIRAFIEKLSNAMHYNQVRVSNKAIYDLLREEYKTFFIGSITGEQIFADLSRIYQQSLDYLWSIKQNYSFLKNPYSKQYRIFFRRRRNIYSLFKTQQIMRKLKNEYLTIDQKITRLEEELASFKNKFEIINEAIETYNKDLGEHQLPNRGFGYLGDGWNDDEDVDDVSTEIRMEESWAIQQEHNLEEAMEAEAEYLSNGGEEEVAELARIEEEEYYQRLINENKPLELFKLNEEKYFEHFKSISIKDFVKLEQLAVFRDLSLEGHFLNSKEKNDWIEKNINPIPF